MIRVGGDADRVLGVMADTLGLRVLSEVPHTIGVFNHITYNGFARYCTRALTCCNVYTSLAATQYGTCIYMFYSNIIFIILLIGGVAQW
jgi:hypothetical protein